MEIAIDDAGSTATVTLVGRLDRLGAESVAVSLATLSGSKNEIVIEMAAVTFVASVDVRLLVSTAKAVQSRGGRVTLLNPTEAVAEVIKTAGVAEYLPTERGTASG